MVDSEPCKENCKGCPNEEECSEEIREDLAKHVQYNLHHFIKWLKAKLSENQEGGE